MTGVKRLTNVLETSINTYQQRVHEKLYWSNRNGELVSIIFYNSILSFIEDLEPDRVLFWLLSLMFNGSGTLSIAYTSYRDKKYNWNFLLW